MSSEDLTSNLHQTAPLFASFTPAQVEEIVALSEVRTFEGNEAIIECGDEGSFIGVLLSGHGEISIADSMGGRNLLSKLEPGDVFGEMSLLTGDRTVADVIAGNRCFVLLIPQDVFNSHILINPKAVTYLSRLLAERTRAMAVDIDSRQLRARAVEQSEDPYSLSLRSATPGKIVALNVGLSQIHFGVYDTENDGRDVHGVIDCGNAGIARVTLTAGGVTTSRERASFPLSDFIKVIFESMLALGDQYLFTPYEVVAVGHRVVHAGNKFSSSAVITPQVLGDIEALSTFAPLHNPLNLEGIREAMRYFPGIPHVAVFD